MQTSSSSLPPHAAACFLASGVGGVSFGEIRRPSLPWSVTPHVWDRR